MKAYRFNEWLSINEVRGLEKFGISKEFGQSVAKQLLVSGKAELKELGGMQEVLAYFFKKKSELSIRTPDVMCGIVFIHQKDETDRFSKSAITILRAISLNSSSTRDITGYFVTEINGGGIREARIFSEKMILDEIIKHIKAGYNAYVLTDLTNPIELKRERSFNIPVDSPKNRYSSVKTEIATYLIANLSKYRKLLEQRVDVLAKQIDEIKYDDDEYDSWNRSQRHDFEKLLQRYDLVKALLALDKYYDDYYENTLIQTSKLIESFIRKLTNDSRAMSDIFKSRNTYEICNIFVIWLLSGKVLSDKKSTEEILNDLGL